MAKFVITITDIGESVRVTAKTYGNEKMDEPTLAQDIGTYLLAVSKDMSKPHRPWWKFWG